MNRIELHEVLKDIIGNNNVYYQPPESLKIQYPAIIYSRNDIENDFANNTVYAQNVSYQVTVIDKNPDSEIVKKVSLLPTARYNRHYVSDNLNHDVFIVYYKN